MTQPTLASFIAMPESSHNRILQAREALETVALQGCNNRTIANAVPYDDGSQRSIDSVRNCLKKMQLVGYMNPKDFLPLRYKPQTAKRLLQTKPVAVDWGIRQVEMFEAV